MRRPFWGSFGRLVASAFTGRFRLLTYAASALVVVIVAGGLFVLLHKPGNVSNPTVPFTTPKTTPTTTTTTTPKKPHHKSKPPDTFKWRLYGYNPQRTRDFVALPPTYARRSIAAGPLVATPRSSSLRRSTRTSCSSWTTQRR